MTSPAPVVPEYGGTLPKKWRPPWAVSEIVMWAVIVIVAAVIAVGAALEQRAGPGQGTRAGSFKFMAQYLLGVRELGKIAAFGGATDAQVLSELEKAAATPEDQVRVAIMAGEISGREEAERRLDAITDPSAVEDAAAAKAILGDKELNAERRAEFHEKYEWFADLAMSIGKPEGDALRMRTLSAARKTFWSFFSVVLAGLGLTGVGLLLLVLGGILLILKKMKLQFTHGRAASDLPEDRRSYLQGFVIYLCVMLAMMLLVRPMLRLFQSNDQLPPMAAGAVQFLALGLAFLPALLWPLFRKQSVAQWRAALGLHAGRGVLREAGCGIAGYVAGLPVIAVGIIVTAILVKLSGLSGAHPVNETITKGSGWIILVFALASIWAPVTEELMFRGALFAHLRERFGWWISAPVVAVVFAIIHPQGWVALPALGAIALVLAGIREWRGSIIGCIAAHAMHNTLTLCVAVMLLRE